LLDENLPRRLTFTPTLPITHATDLAASGALEGPTDTLLWEHAAAHRLAIVSKDADFADRIMLGAPPPWVVRLAFGNLRLRDYHTVLARAWPQIEALLPAHKLLIVHADRIEAVKG
jgi:predicted nuclease of predicted toxin-antitoxin system